MSDNDFEKLAKLLRYYSLVSTTEAGSGHPTSCLSAADLMAVLLDKYYYYDFKKPENLENDRLIFSKGHAAPLLYSMYAAAGEIDEKELKTLRKKGSRLAGHPVPSLIPWVDVATGSLGQGLSAGVGMALASKYLHKKDNRIFVLMGDSEVAEGSVWEAAASASYHNLDNIVGILDVNRLGQSQETMYGHNLDVYKKRARAFGWETIVIDGHDLKEIDGAFSKAMKHSGSPFMIIAKTFKGKGIPFLEDKEGKHGKALSREELEKALSELGEIDKDLTIDTKKKVDRIKINHDRIESAVVSESNENTDFKIGDEIATREAYGIALADIGGKNNQVVALDGETKNSTHAETFMNAHPDRYFEMFIAEQNMVGAALGLSKAGLIPFVSTFAAFFTRAYDQIRMSAVSSGNVKLVGSHAGVSIGEDGISQMGLEDLAMMRAVHESAVLYPFDAVSTKALVLEMINYNGVVYMRTTRGKTPVIYDEKEKFSIGGSKTVKKSNTDAVCVCAAGITLHEAIKAYEELSKDGILVRVIDLYSVKPIDAQGLMDAARESGNRVIVVEDHWFEGGLGDAVLNVFAASPEVEIVKMAVTEFPGVGNPVDMMKEAGIDSQSIIKKVRELVE